MTASFTFTADSGTDVLTTSSAHGKATGDGPICVRNVGGALPTGLSALTDYWLIVTGASTVKLATSSANALLGTAINLTTNGTGTNYLEIGIPYRRPRTYAVGSQLKSADLNDNFDAWKALYALLTGQSESIWSGAVSLTGALSVGGALIVGSTSTFTNAVTLTGGISGQIILNGTLSPAALSGGNNNNYNPTSLSDASIVRLNTAGGSPFLTGVAGGTGGRILHLWNIGGDTIAVTNQDGSSTAANRIITGSGATVNVATNQCITLAYDGVDSRWRLIAKNF